MVGVEEPLEFAHGKEDLRPSCHLSKKKAEDQLCKLFSSGSCAYGSKCRFVHHQVKEAVLSTELASAAKLLPSTMETISPIRLENTINSCENITITPLTSTDWHPLHDRISLALPSASNENPLSKEDTDAHILAVLYGPSERKRLPAFTEFCPE